MKSLLSFVVSNHASIDLVYRFLHTPNEMKYVLSKAEVKPKSLVYISLHGRPNFVKTGKQSEFSIPLDDIASYMGKKYKGCGIHFASCAVMASDKNIILDFMKKTKVSFVSGYTNYVDFSESSLMDLALLQRWIWTTYNRPMLEKLFVDYPSMVRANGFAYYMKP